MSFSKKSIFGWVVGIGALVLLGLIFSHLFRQTIGPTFEKVDDQDKLALQVPLQDTALLRVDFLNELKSWKDPLHPRGIYEKWIGKIGANGIIETLQTANPECHDSAHDLGRIIFAKVGDVGDALHVCNGACNSACMHGVLMEFFQKSIVVATSTPKKETSEHEDDDSDHIKIEDIKDKMFTICGNTKTSGDPTMAKDYKQGDCAHGVGHALMFLAKYDIKKAIDYCSLFPEEPLKYYCSTGAYMEYITTHDASDLQDHPGDVFYPCTTADYPAACFRYKFPHVVGRHYQAGKKFNDLVKFCLGLEGKYQTGCFHGLGNGHFVPVANKQATLADICHHGNHDDVYACTEGLMERLGRYEPENALRQCDTVKDWQKELCLADAKHELYDLTKPFSLYKR